MFCQNCGLELHPQAVICPRCGFSIPQPPPPESSTLSILALVFAFVSPLAGLILAIVGMVQSRDPKNKKRSTIALICSIAFPAVLMILYFVFIFYFILVSGLLLA